jgi:mannosyltransferase OCH1-like enzyme
MVLCGGCSSPFVNAEDVHPVIVRESPRNLRVRPEVVSQLQALPEIPHKLHIIWPDREVVFKKDEMVLHGIRKMIDLNPDWTYTVYNHDDIDNYLKKELTRESPVLSQSDIDLMMTVRVCARVDG